MPVYKRVVQEYRGQGCPEVTENKYRYDWLDIGLIVLLSPIFITCGIVTGIISGLIMTSKTAYSFVLYGVPWCRSKIFGSY